MASGLFVKRASSALENTFSVFRVSLNYLRSQSTDAAATSGGGDESAKRRRKKKKKNLFEVAQFLPNWGVGYHMAKAHWSGVSYQITKINLYKDGRHGKAWGIAHRDGVQIADAPKKISGVHKRCWKYLSNVKTSEESALKPEPQTV